jgi:preprotein translocase subunit SecA
VFFISLEDDLARLFGGDRLKSVANLFNLPEDEPITSMKLMSNQIELAQKRVEGTHFSIRRNLLQFDNVLAQQRDIIYAERNKVLDGVDVHEEIVDMIKEQVKEIVHSSISNDKLYSEWDLEELNKELELSLFEKGTNFITEDNIEGFEVKNVVKLVADEVVRRYNKKGQELKELGINMADIERAVLLRQVDFMWVDHIDAMTMLRNEISTRTDPITAYKQEGFEMFEEIIERIRKNTALILLNGKVERTPIIRKQVGQNLVAGPVKVQTVVKKAASVGRNDQCPCGSGKKYKQCCGK